MAHEVVQQIIGEMEYTGTARDDAVWWQLQDIEDQNGLPYDLDADSLYRLYNSNYGGGERQPEQLVLSGFSKAWERRRQLRAQVSAIRLIHGEGERLDEAQERLFRFEDIGGIIVAREHDGTL